METTAQPRGRHRLFTRHPNPLADPPSDATAVRVPITEQERVRVVTGSPGLLAALHGIDEPAYRYVTEQDPDAWAVVVDAAALMDLDAVPRAHRRLPLIVWDWGHMLRPADIAGVLDAGVAGCVNTADASVLEANLVAVRRRLRR